MRRIIVIALPWLAAEHRLRIEGRPGIALPFAVVEQPAGALRLAGINPAASTAGLVMGQSLADARAICPALLTRPAVPEALDSFVRALCRWAERFSPLIGRDLGPSLVLDATGVAHLFGGEAAMLDTIIESFAEYGLTARAAFADSRGAAWALAHYGMEDRIIAPPGHNRQAIGKLPVAALRIAPETAEGLATVGLRTIEPLTRMPRGALARRFGIEIMRRLDQALGAEPEPVAPEARMPAFSARMTLPEPIGLVADMVAALEILLERLCTRLEDHRMGARWLQLIARRVDGADQKAEIRLARPGRDPIRLRELFKPKLDEIEAGFGIDALRLIAPEVEPMGSVQLGEGKRESEEAKLADLVSRLGNRIGFDNIVRFLPAESHAPERAQVIAPAAHSTAVSWPPIARPPRPVTIFPPERLAGTIHEAGKGIERLEGMPRSLRAEAADPTAMQGGIESSSDERTPSPATPPGPARNPGRNEGARKPPASFIWRGRKLTTACAHGPERLAPEWWLDDPGWRSGLRDYWRVETAEGPRLWLFYTPADPAGPDWYVQGVFA